MSEINLMDVYPPSQRTWERILERSSLVTPEKQEIGRRFGSEYFDGDSSTGYGGYCYDGRWVRIAERLRDHYKLSSGSRILDVGCAKGFLVKDLTTVVSGCEPFGIDLSEYAIQEAPGQARARLAVSSAHSLPFGNNQFDLVVVQRIVIQWHSVLVAMAQDACQQKTCIGFAVVHRRTRNAAGESQLTGIQSQLPFLLVRAMAVVALLDEDRLDIACKVHLRRLGIGREAEGNNCNKRRANLVEPRHSRRDLNKRRGEC